MVYAAGDVDRDGYMDFLVAPRAYGTAFQLYTGAKTGPTPHNDATTVSGFVLKTISNGDVNGDGYADFLTVREPYPKLYLGQADVTSLATTPFGSTTASVIVGDLNGDGYDDIQDGSSIYFGGSPVDTTSDLVLQ
jgi:hypothetical protein